MLKKLALGILISVMTVGTLLAGDAPQTTPPAVTPATKPGTPSGAKMFIEKTDFNFGYVPGSSTISHSFFMYNKGTDTLKIFSVKPG